MKNEISEVIENFKSNSTPFHPGMWQGIDVSQNPQARMFEQLHVTLTAPLNQKDLSWYREEIEPNLPWADDHFEKERVSGHPFNPGTTWTSWPYGHAAARALEGNRFNHTYAERFWPRWAGVTPGGLIPDEPPSGRLRGIRHPYGDLNDLVNLLVKQPGTRQAYVPVWFPEDGSHMDRKPCTLGYHFILRDGKFDVTYYIRSCDIYRHFRDDIYLCVRLLLWILDQTSFLDRLWLRVKPGTLRMHITSLHCFVNDMFLIK
jgi:hypothetical protein